MSFLKREDIQLAEPFSERRLFNKGRFDVKWYPPYILQTKLNGERCRAIVQSPRCLLLSSTGAIINTVLHINEAMLHFPDGEYDGELYVHGWTFSDIHSVISSTVTTHPRAHEMEYHIFDIIDEKTTQLERLSTLVNIFPYSYDCIYKVRTDIVNTLEEIMLTYDQYISEGYEGFIIRHIDGLYVRRRNAIMMKFKPKKTDIYPIIWIKEAISKTGEGLGMLGSFTCQDDMDTIFDVGAGKLTHPERKRIYVMWLDDLIKPHTHYLEVEYQTMSDKKHAPLFSRAVKLIDATLKKST